ncbi:MAG: phosphorylase [Synechococcales cyanobacterium M58_A2018_015]|nr:phosphorylase [Synechococcales cyanobacterium M58_A2018_015]
MGEPVAQSLNQSLNSPLNPPSDQQTLQLLQPGTLWEKAVARSQQALACGALHPIPTDFAYLEQGGMQFLVRILANLARKEAAKQQVQQTSPTGTVNPFLPYETDLFVADLSETHLCLLNKYNVVDHHLLIITRDFEEQETLLNQRDFAALWTCLCEIDGLGFYNSGKTAGASQRHKHLQLVPLPLLPNGEKIPVEPLLNEIAWQTDTEIGPIGQATALPFRHGLIRLSETDSPAAADHLLQAYSLLLRQLDLYDPAVSTHSPLGAYNLLVTRQWMLVVPRSQEQYQSISINSLGFAGTLFVRDPEQFQRLQSIGPMTLLQQVAMPR